ncbi:aminotransferase class I/II-fold pyridoxal phosphate-dependent enzyme [Clostridiaceae bacterium HFYG-1003]|nr:aminotransferase class I/II-fold pyridoxal phosphate-dependent enzyme [Clostridiaceae bacterium HFYG-1003]
MSNNENVENEHIWLASPHMSDEGFEKEYIEEAFATNWIAPLGKNVNEFEIELAALIDRKAAAALVSGTSAIHLALKAAKVRPGDRVLCQSLTFSASANPILYEQAVPVFIDSSPDTWNIDPDLLEEALKSYDHVGAVIVVDLYGLGSDYERIEAICQKYNVPLIEDAAEALGSVYQNRPAGSFGDFGILSFNGNKIITTSGGGMVLSNNQKAIDKIKFWATQSRDLAKHYEHSELGYNYRLSNVLAGIGRGQLKVLSDRVSKKQEIYHYYREHLEGLEGVSFMPEVEGHSPNYWLTSILLDGPVSASQLIQHLADHNIDARKLWKPMHLQPIFQKYDFWGSDVSERLFQTGVCLPSDTKMTLKQMERIVAVIKQLWDRS